MVLSKLPNFLFFCFIVYTKHVYSSLGTSILPWADDQIIESGYPDFDDLFISRSRRNGGIRAPPPKQYELHPDISRIKIYSDYPNDPSRRFVCDSTMYTLGVTKEIMITYKPHGGIKCMGIKYDCKKVWKRDSKKDTDYPKRIHFLFSGPVVVEMNEDLYYFSTRRLNGRYKFVPMGRFDFNADDVKFITLNSTQNPVDFKPEGLKIINHGFFMEYTFAFGTKCEGLRLKDQFPWLYDDSIYPEYPSSLYLFANAVLVVCAGRSFVKQFDLNNPDQHHTPYEVVRLPLTGFKFAKKRGCLFYEIDSRVKCVGVNYGDKEVWEYDVSKPNSPYPKTVIFFIRGSTALVNFGGRGDLFRLENGEWKSFFSGKPKPRHLNIAKTKSTGVFEYEKTEKVYTYTANGNHLFGKVKVSNWFLRSETMIWNAVDLVDCATKVVYDKTDSDNVVLTIHHVNGLKSVFKKQSKLFNSEPWEGPEVKCSETKLNPEDIEILFEGENRESFEHENCETPEYGDLPEPTTLATPVSESRPAEDDDPKALLDSETKVDTDTEEPISGEMQDETERAEVVQVTSQESEISVPSIPSDAPSTFRIRVHLDIRIRKSTEQFDYSQSIRFWTYTAKGNCYFRSIKDCGKEIWSGVSLGESALKVIAEVDAYSTLVGLTLRLVNTHIKRFKIFDGRLQGKAFRDPTGLPQVPFEPSTDPSSQQVHDSKGIISSESSSASSQLPDISPSLSVPGPSSQKLVGGDGIIPLEPRPTTLSLYKESITRCPSTNEAIAIHS